MKVGYDQRAVNGAKGGELSNPYKLGRVIDRLAK